MRTRRGVALLAVLVVLSLAATAVATVLAVVRTELGAARAAAAGLRGETALADLEQEVLADRTRLSGPSPVWPLDTLRQVTATPLAPLGPGRGLWLELWARSGPARRGLALVVQTGSDSLGPRIVPLALRGALRPIY